MMIDDRVQLEAEKPAYGRLATLSKTVEDAMLDDPLVVADLQRCAINQGKARAVALTQVQIHKHWNADTRH